MRGLVASGSAVVWSVLENAAVAAAAARPFDANQQNKRASCWNNFCGSMNMCVSVCVVAYVCRLAGSLAGSLTCAQGKQIGKLEGGAGEGVDPEISGNICFSTAGPKIYSSGKNVFGHP